jgi:amino acid permease
VSDDLFSRDEILAGHPGRQAHRALFLIESRAAHLAAHSRQAMELISSPTATKERDLAFLEAFTLGHDPPLKPTIHDLERFAARWSDLAPESPRVRAALAHVLGEKYRFTRRAVPGIRAALGLDTPEVGTAYQRLYGAPLDRIYALRPSLLHLPGWIGVHISRWVESLPSFWTAYSLSVTETIGTSILALPIVVATLGPVPGLVVLLLIGMMTTLTLVSISEAVARSGSVRYGDAYFGRIVARYLGAPGALLVSGTLALFVLVFLVALYAGVGATLSSAISLPPAAGAALLFGCVFFLLTRPSLIATVSSALVTGAVSIALILLMAVFALPHLSLANLEYTDVPFVNGHAFHASILQLTFGVGLAAYFGHVSVGNCARAVLREDASARSLIWGGIAAQLTAIIVYAVWVIAVNGAVPRQQLAGLAGTAISPLAHVAGAAVLILGAGYVIIGLGISAVHYSFGLRNLAREWIPVRSDTVLALAIGRGRLLFGSPHVGCSADLAYLGLQDGHPAFRIEVQTATGTRRADVVVDGRCSLRAETARLLSDARGAVDAYFDVLDADETLARVRVNAAAPPAYDGDWVADAAGPGEVLELPERERGLLRWIMRRGSATFAEIGGQLELSDTDTRALLQSMVRQGALREVPGAEGPSYRPRIARKRESRLAADIWDAVGMETASPATGARSPAGPSILWHARMRLLTEGGRTWLALAPVAAVFAIAEWLIVAGRSSFAAPLDFVGVITVSILAGVLPVLLLVASRRRGEYVPGLVFRVLGYPPVAAAIYLVFLANLLAHGFVLWKDPLERACALAAAALVVAVTLWVVRRGAFRRRTVVELRADPGGSEAVFSVVASGRPLSTQVTLNHGGQSRTIQAATGTVTDLEDLRYLILELPVHDTAELEVWGHRVTELGTSEPLAGTVELRRGEEVQHYDLQAAGGRVMAAVPDGRWVLTLTLPVESRTEPVFAGRRGKIP